jgi:predicted nuclease of predicted toxin-antitoxin system
LQKPADPDATFEGLANPQVLELAAAEERVLVTRNSRDFASLAIVVDHPKHVTMRGHASP